MKYVEESAQTWASFLKRAPEELALWIYYFIYKWLKLMVPYIPMLYVPQPGLVYVLIYNDCRLTIQ